MSLQFGPEYVRAMAPYVAGKPISEVAREFGLDASRIVKLASNENPLGMPASAKAAMAVAIDELARYPDANGFSLKAALHAKFGVPEAWITLGNGSNDILELAARALVAPGQGVIYAQHSFAVYALAAQEVGARAIEVPARDYGHDLEAMAAATTPDTRLIYIANPNNPTGTFLSADAIAAFLAQVPPAVVVVLDEAYNEFLAPAQQYDSVAWVRRYPNLLVSRTLWAGGSACRLWHRAAATGGPAQSDPPAVQRQQPRAGRRCRRTERRRIPAQIGGTERRGLCATDAGIRAPRVGICPIVGQLCAGPCRRRCGRGCARQSGAAQAGRDRATGGQLRSAAVAAHQHRAAGGECRLHRCAGVGIGAGEGRRLTPGDVLRSSRG